MTATALEGILTAQSLGTMLMLPRGGLHEMP